MYRSYIFMFRKSVNFQFNMFLCAFRSVVRLIGCKINHNFQNGFEKILQLERCSTRYQTLNSFISSKSLFSTNIDRRQPVITKIDTPEFHSLFTPEFKRLTQLFKDNGYEIRMAGGIIRDLLCDKQGHIDIDLATTATPDQMKEMFTKEEIRMFNNKGEKHGTISVRINDKQNFEITTLRVDVVCDGRRAQVQFITDWFLDSNRRDLTINSMFLGIDGTLYDYFDGVGDLKRKRVVFVGDPAKRIQEDYLRILRYFRFFGRIAVDPNAHEPEMLDAIRSNVSGLKIISVQRIWSELKRILVGNFAPAILKLMVTDMQMGIYLRIPDDAQLNFKEMQRVYECTRNRQPNHMTILAALFDDDEPLYLMCLKLQTSNAERECAVFILKYRSEIDFDNAELAKKQLQDLMVDQGVEHERNARARVLELIKYSDCAAADQLIDHFSHWQLPEFPLDAYTVITKCKVNKGRPCRAAIGILLEKWKQSNYELSADQLIDMWPGIRPHNIDSLKGDVSELAAMPIGSAKLFRTARFSNY